ncbi:nuclear factor 7, ovary-like [Megalops cyprinoides]|uniref:nuclear factor 7, ovary-like n=1 Tax=Megalops cyprinoides TaxID=118141 RepID=UPI0018642D1F|nr:nuclear factor 7, ovary-like [Megalops cyprinoides]
MQGGLAVMTQALTARREREQMLRSALHISESDRFQQWWISKGSSAVEELRNRGGRARGPRGQAANDEFKSEAKGLCVTPHSPHSPSLGPYDSHLQLFVWKEMLQVIKPVLTCVTLEDLHDPLLKVSADSVRHVELNSRTLWGLGEAPEFSMSHTWSQESFRSGQHYWEVTVGEKSHWSLGLDAQLSSSKQAICRLNGRFGKHRVKTQKEIPLNLPVRPKKIGTFLDCERKRISFYNADNMSLIHSTAYDTDKSLFVYFNPGFYFKGENGDPLTVCCY